MDKITQYCSGSPDKGLFTVDEAIKALQKEAYLDKNVKIYNDNDYNSLKTKPKVRKNKNNKQKQDSSDSDSKSQSKSPSPPLPMDKVDFVQRPKLIGIPTWNSLSIQQPFKKPRVEKAETKLPFKKPFDAFRTSVSTIKPNKDVQILRGSPEFGHELIPSFYN